jgi:hypothetical protein
LETAAVEVCVDESWEQRQPTSVNRFAARDPDVAPRSGRDDPVAFDHNDRIFYRRAASAINESRAGDEDRRHWEKHELIVT